MGALLAAGCAVNAFHSERVLAKTGAGASASRVEAPPVRKKSPVRALPLAEPAHADPPPNTENDGPNRPAESAHFKALAVPGFLDAVVALPGSEAAEPVLVATHGAGGAPEHHCEAWRELLGDNGIVVCPRGKLINVNTGPAGGYYYPDHRSLEREVMAVVASFEASYQKRVRGKDYVYFGYSQGATMGALMLPEHAALFTRLMLIEGGFQQWDLKSAQRFRANGGQRVAFVCGTRSCRQGAERSAFVLERAKLAVTTRYAAGAGHTYGGSVYDQVAKAFAWLVESDERWNAEGQNR